MILVYIENKVFLTRILSYLDEINLPYTTDLKANYDILVIAEYSSRVKTLVQESEQKRIIFLTELEETKLVKHITKSTKSSKNYLMHFIQLCNQCTRIVVTMPSILKWMKKKCKREILLKPRELPIINISKSNKDIFDKYHISKRSKKVIIVDYNYEHLDYVSAIAYTYPKYQIILIGYEKEYMMSHKTKELYHTLPKNVIKQKYIDLNLYSDFCKISWLVIYFYTSELDSSYLDLTLLLKRQLLLENHFYYQDYFINSKNAYIFQTVDELLLRLKKIIEERVANLTDNGYDLIAQNTHKRILEKWIQMLTI